MTTVFMFSGQGSQFYGMGRELRSHPVFEKSLWTLDALFADHGLPGVMAEMSREDRTASDPFDRLRYTHPSILMIELALLDTLLAEGVEPDYVLGASLGEFAAAVAAGVIGREELARSIAEQVRLVEQLCPPGGMTAVLADLDRYRQDPQLSRFELAAVNFDRHFVVSGAETELTALETYLAAEGIARQRLPVRYAFHSERMDDAAETFLQMLPDLTRREPQIPFVSCATAGLVAVPSPEHFWHMVRSPIRFADAIRFLEDREGGGLRYLDLGPSATMANFTTQNLRTGRGSQAIAVLDPFAPPGRGLERAGASRRPQADASITRPRGRENMTAILFPGQGSQVRGMGRDVFADFPDLVAEADAILGYSVEELCVQDPQRNLDRTQFTQPALFVVSALQYLKRTREGASRAHFFAGHSLGEYTALFAAGAFDFATGVRLVSRRGELMAGMTGGGMAAVTGLSPEEIRAVLSQNGLTDLDLANFNGAGQVIVSGPAQTVGLARDAFEAAGAQGFYPLRVSGAFHSRYMEPARQDFERFLSGFSLRPPTVPVVANVTALPYAPGAIVATLAEQLVRPVQWEQTVRYLLGQGVVDLVEVGPGRVLTKLVTKIQDVDRATVMAGPQAAARPSGAPASGAPTSGALGTTPAEWVPLARREPVESGSAAVLAPAEMLGSAAFRAAYGVRYAYVCGSMFRGIASEELVVRAGRAGVLAFFGTGGLSLERIDAAVSRISDEIGPDRAFGMNLVHNPTLPAVEESTVALLLRRGVRNLEASAFMKVTRALVRYRVAGLAPDGRGGALVCNRIIAKVSRPEVAESFLSPAPERLLRDLEADGFITREQAELAAGVPMADDLCVEADSGGHTDRRGQLVLLPTIRRLRDRIGQQHGYAATVRVGAAGGIGTPEAAAAAFLLGADFIVTGSINLCTVESGMSSVVKGMLEQIDIQDTDYAPAGDMFELGAQVQVLKRGVFFPARARKLYDLYRRHESLDEIDQDTRTLIESRYFGRSFDDVWRSTVEYFADKDAQEIAKAEQSPKHKMALVFRWYFGYSQRAAMDGAEEHRVDFQVHVGPALGAFNQWVKGTPLESWQNRHVDEIAEKLMIETADYLGRSLAMLSQGAR